MTVAEHSATMKVIAQNVQAAGKALKGGDAAAATPAAEALATAIVRLSVPFDQVIWYAPERGGHVHVSFTTKRRNRSETLHAPAAGGYVPWRPSAPRIA